MNVRVFKPEDYDDVYALWLSCKGLGLNDIDDSRAGIEKYLDRNPRTSFVCEEDGKILGMIIAGNDGRRGYIYHTAVSPDARRRGIAAKLVEAAVDALDKEGITKVALVVFDRNSTGNEFWEKMGFSEREDLIYRNKAIAKLKRIDL